MHIQILIFPHIQPGHCHQIWPLFISGILLQRISQMGPTRLVNSIVMLTVDIVYQYKMGNGQIKSELRQNEVYLNQIHYKNQNDLMFQSKLSNSSSSTKLLRKLYPFNSASENVTGYLQKLNFFGQYIDCDNLMLPVYCYIHETRGMCSEQKSLEIYHEIYSINIKDQIVARKKHYQKFNQNQVWYLLYSIINACRKFEPYKIKSGNLKTNQVILNKQGHVKVKNILTEPQSRPNALPNYFSPQELKNMRESRTTKVHPNISQTFSIAIIILQICTFVDGESLYDMFRMKINEVSLTRCLEMVQKMKYSKLLQNLLKIMLSDHVDRPLPSQIYLTFKPYESQIINLQSFKFDTTKIYETLQNSKVSVTSRY